MKKNYKIEKTKEGYFEAIPRPTQQELDNFYKNLYFGEGVTDTYPDNYTNDEIAQKKLRAN